MSVCAIASKHQARLVVSRIRGLECIGVALILGWVPLRSEGLRSGNGSSDKSKTPTAETRGLGCVLISSMGLDQQPEIPVHVCMCAHETTGRQ